MTSKTLKYLSYGIVFLALLLFAIFSFLTEIKVDMILLLIPTVAISYLLKVWALKKANSENQDEEYINALQKEIKTAKWAGIALLCFAGIKIIIQFF